MRHWREGFWGVRVQYPMHRILAAVIIPIVLSSSACLCAAPSVSADPLKRAIPPGSGAGHCHAAGAAPVEPTDKGRSSSNNPSCPHCLSVCAMPAGLSERPFLTDPPRSIPALRAFEDWPPIESGLPQPDLHAPDLISVGARWASGAGIMKRAVAPLGGLAMRRHRDRFWCLEW